MPSPDPAAPCLAELEAMPVAERWPLARDWIRRTPGPFFAQLRDRAPILDCGAVVLVAKRADVAEILSLPSVFSVALYKPKMGTFMLALDGTEVNYRDKAVMRAVLPWGDLPAIRRRAGRDHRRGPRGGWRIPRRGQVDRAPGADADRPGVFRVRGAGCRPLALVLREPARPVQQPALRRATG